MQRIERSCCNSVPIKNIPRGTITSVVDCFRNQGSMENIPRKRKQPNLEDRNTLKLLRSVKENRKRSLSDVTVLFNQNRESAVFNEVFRELCTSRYILGALN